MSTQGRTRQGFTLIEVIVGSVLFIGIGLVIFGLLQWGLEAQALGTLQQNVTQQARAALKNMKDELGQSMPPPPLNNPLFNNNPLPSSVFVPSSYPLGSDPETFVDPNNPNQADSFNIFIFTATSKDLTNATDAQNFNPTNDPTQFNWVVYYVSNFASLSSPNPPVVVGPPPAPGTTGTPQNGPAVGQTGSGCVLWRMVVGTFPTGTTIPTSLNSTGFVAGPGTGQVLADSTPAGAILGTNGANNFISQDPIVALNDGDVIQFTVHHGPANNANTIGATDPTFFTVFDRKTFGIDVSVTQVFHTHGLIAGGAGVKGAVLAQAGLRTKTSGVISDAATLRSFP